MQITQGDTVKIHYVGTLGNGEQFDNSYERGEPLQFRAGVGLMIPGFDNGVIGMSLGEKKTLNITASEAYGERSEHAIQTIPRENFPEDFDAKVGAIVEGRDQSGMPMRAMISNFDENNVILDFNHPLAGQDLVFEVEVMEVIKGE